MSHRPAVGAAAGISNPLIPARNAAAQTLVSLTGTGLMDTGLTGTRLAGIHLTRTGRRVPWIGAYRSPGTGTTDEGLVITGSWGTVLMGPSRRLYQIDGY